MVQTKSDISKEKRIWKRRLKRAKKINGRIQDALYCIYTRQDIYIELNNYPTLNIGKFVLDWENVDNFFGIEYEVTEHDGQVRYFCTEDLILTEQREARPQYLIQYKWDGFDFNSYKTTYRENRKFESLWDEAYGME